VSLLTARYQILSFIDDPKVLARASQVSTRWRDLLSDDMTWKNLCVKHDYGRRFSETNQVVAPYQPPRPSAFPLVVSDSDFANHSFPGALPQASVHMSGSRSFDSSGASSSSSRPKLKSYKSHFKQRYLVDAAWKAGGRKIAKNITQDGGVVTSLHLTPKYIIVALDNAKIHVFDTDGNGQKTLQGHVMGVWAMVPWEDILVSGGCDRDVRVWNLLTGYANPFPSTLPLPLLLRIIGGSHDAAIACTLSAATYLPSGVLRCRIPTPPSQDPGIPP